MATTTTKSKAKTKTAKKPSVKSASAKTTKVSTKAKTAAKKAPVKARATKATAAAKAKKPTTSKTIAKPAARAEAKKPAVTKTAATWHSGFVFAAVVMVVQAVVAALYMKLDSAQVFLGHLTKNELASTNGTVLAPAAHPLYEVEFRWLLVVLLGVSAIFAVLRGTRYFKRELAGIQAQVQPLRWLDFAITGAIMFEIVALLNGLQDAVALKLGMISIAASAYFAWRYERENAVTGKPAKATRVASYLTAGLPVLALLVTMYGTYMYGIVRSPWYAYAAAAVFVLGLVATPRSLNKLRTIGKHDYVTFDKTLNVQNLLVKIAFAVILIVGLYSKK